MFEGKKLYPRHCIGEAVLKTRYRRHCIADTVSQALSKPYNFLNLFKLSYEQLAMKTVRRDEEAVEVERCLKEEKVLIGRKDIKQNCSEVNIH